jgi:hypothetical protein
MFEQVQLYGITKDDIQAIFEKVIAEHKGKMLPRWIYTDCSYLYNFHLDDFETIRKINILGRYSLRAVMEWHKILERWLCDQTVVLGCKQIKPIMISRSFDRVVNEAMEDVAKFFTGGVSGDVIAPYKFHAIGSGVFGEVLPSDKQMVNQVSRIDVTKDPNGGSMSRDGSTIYIIGNHPKSIEQGNMSELGAFNALSTSSDRMLDHSMFATPIVHQINQDIAGGTIIVWQCSS